MNRPWPACASWSRPVFSSFAPPTKGRCTLKPPRLDLPGTQAPFPELEPEDGYMVIQKENLYAIVRRVPALDVLLMELIACRTTSARKKSKAGKRPKFADISKKNFEAYTGRPSRTISLRLTSSARFRGMKPTVAACVMFFRIPARRRPAGGARWPAGPHAPPSSVRRTRRGRASSRA